MLREHAEVAQTYENFRANREAAVVNLAQTKYQRGRVLQFDPIGERLVGFGASQANALLMRNDRQPFVVPALKAFRL